MKTPTLEEVKAYFKDAKEVSCLFNGITYDISKAIIREDRPNYYEAYFEKEDDYCRIYKNGKYAKIISYKEKTMKNYKKIDHFEPIAMKCTEEQFNELKPILEKFGCIIEHISTDFSTYSMLVNNNFKQENHITNHYAEKHKKRVAYESFNKKTFLKACGIVEKSEKVKIRTELLKQLAENNSFSEELIKKEFPKLFDTPNDIITIVEKYGKDKVISLIEKM